MHSASLKKYITVDTKLGPQKLKVEEYTRWLSLLEALDIVTRKASQFKVDLQSKDVDWIKPLAFQKYIVERYESMVDEVINNEQINCPTTIKKAKCTTLQEPVLQ